jgi:hypothetical protein
MAYAEPSDVQVRLGRDLTASEVNQAFAMLDDVEAEIRMRVSDLDDRTADPYYLTLVIRVEAGAVKRVLMNPGAVRQHSESLDDYSQSDTIDSAVSTGALYVSDDEWSLLDGGGGPASSGSFSMAVGYP